MKVQSLSNKLAEVNFRKKISKQQFSSVVFYPSERTFQKSAQELRNRVKRTIDDFKSLKRKGVNFDFYFEIGSEYCERPMALEKKFKVNGIASDISLSSLQTASDFTSKLGFKSTPKRLVCDAYDLPFKNNALPFVFCYQTLHHFPDPKPILEEIYRVLSPGGVFFFKEEPIKQLLNIPLWRRPTVLRPWEKILKYIGILPFISRIGKTEVDFGILEEVFSLKTWENALNVFDKVETITKPFPVGPTSINLKSLKKNWLKPSPLTWLLISWWGGGIGATCWKKGNTINSNVALSEIFACPNCLTKKRSTSLGLTEQKKYLKCPNCSSMFPKKQNIPVLLPNNSLKKLYPKLTNND